jgi:periplasmic divalent cation tolerance protein
MRAIVVVTTVGTEEQANQIAGELVARRHAACVNVVPGIRSIYRWKGKICRDGELLLIVKTLEEELEAVEATIRELHSYELPEILSFDVGYGEKGFLDWIRSSIDKDADFSDEVEEELSFED